MTEVVGQVTLGLVGFGQHHVDVVHQSCRKLEFRGVVVSDAPNDLREVRQSRLHALCISGNDIEQWSTQTAEREILCVVL